MGNIGEQIESNGWRQGKVFNDEELPASVKSQQYHADSLFVITMQSCDLVHYQLEDEPYAECIECQRIEEIDGNYTFAKNPRRLHLSISHIDGTEQPVEILAHRIFRFHREELASIIPSVEQYLSEKGLKTLVRWLASRYDRPAFPAEFNDRLRPITGKLKGKATKMSEAVTGLYIETIPMENPTEEGEFHVNLLALVSIDFDGDMAEIEANVKEYADLMNEVGLETMAVVRKENAVPVSVFRRFDRLDFDYLSLRADPTHSLPPDR
ncbi:MAG: hypothetical protein BA866_04850 [Desulfobulbaceae bacterium S5133MH15]|nr:MAG: hypothetical protein BA866_04850 [Desulfobulbaceae bacterium S5133MH15]